MPDPGGFPLTELLSSAGSVVVLVFVGAVLLVLWQVAIMLGAILANFSRRHRGEDTKEAPVG